MFQGTDCSTVKTHTHTDWETDTVPIVQKAGWTPVLVWKGAENLASTGFDPKTVRRPVSSANTYGFTNVGYLGMTTHYLSCGLEFFNHYCPFIFV
jgi:hypothetical protein